MNLQNKITTTELSYIAQGADKYDFFLSDLTYALTHNPFADHYFFSSDPGYSKTFSANKLIGELGLENQVIKFNGEFGFFAFAADIATVLIRMQEIDPNGTSKIYALLDDSDSLLDKKNINSTKNMFNSKNPVLEYRKSLGGQYSSLDDTQKAAINQFKTEGRSGFCIPLDRFVFIFLSNKALANSDDIARATDNRVEYVKSLAAIHRRVEYKEIEFAPGVDWGYCAHIFTTYPMAEQFMPNITDEQKIEILQFTSPTNNWNRIKDRNLSVFEKMVKDMVRFPNNYRTRWVDQYLKQS